MKLAIDMQGAQGQSRQRGIGRYTLSLVRGLLRQPGEHSIYLILNGNFLEATKDLYDEFSQYLPIERLRIWYAPTPLNHLDPKNDQNRQLAADIYHAFIEHINPDCLLITSLFEGLGDNAFTAILPPEQRTYSVACILYDLIPLIYTKPYLDNPAHKRWYMEKITHLKQADHLLSISASSCQEGITHLQAPESGITNISSAIDDFFKPVTLSTERSTVLRNHYNLRKPFLMYTGGIDHRKNLERLIAAFAHLPEALRKTHQLAIICQIQPAEKARLIALANQHKLSDSEIVFTGFVPEQDLLELYNLCQAFVFPSLHEGFGLPVLEAMACGAPVIAANTSSLPEVIGFKDALFDPFSIESISSRMIQVLSDDNYRQMLIRQGLEQAQTFSWDKTAETTWKTLQSLASDIPLSPSSTSERPKLAMVSPLPPQRSGISDYTQLLLPELAAYYRLELICPEQPDSECTAHGYPWRTPKYFLEHIDQYDRIVYQFGNSAFHSHMFALLEKHPGVVVLHDFYLSGVIAHQDYTGAAPGSWTKALYHSHGYPAVQARHQQQDPAPTIWEYPCSLEVVQHALAIISHAPFSARLAKRWYGYQAEHDWSVIPLVRPSVEPDKNQRAQARQLLGIDQQARVVCSFGFIGSTKLNHALLDAWCALPEALRRSNRLIFVGENDPGAYGQSLQAKINTEQLNDQVMITGWVSSTTYKQYLQAANIGVQLRTLSRGETSAAVLDCMSYGLATLVNSNGSMADLSDDVVCKIPDNFSLSSLTNKLAILLNDTEFGNRLGQNAARQILKQHTPVVCAKAYYQAIEATYNSPKQAMHRLLQTLKTRALTHPIEPATLCQLSAAIDRSFPSDIHPRQLLLDISLAEPGQLMYKVMQCWLTHPPEGFRVEPVCLNEEGILMYARHKALAQIHCPNELLINEPVAFNQGDIWLGLELPEQHHDQLQSDYHQMRQQGVHLGITNTGKIPGETDQQLTHLQRLFEPTQASDQQTIWVDISELAKKDAGTGIQRVVRSLLDAWENQAPSKGDIQLVVANLNEEGYQHATQFALKQSGWPTDLLPNLAMSPEKNDIFLGLDLHPLIVARQAKTYREWRTAGVFTAFVVYDLLCIEHPEWFLPGAQKMYQSWLNTIAEADQLLCISQDVAKRLEQQLQNTKAPQIDWFQLGCDFTQLQNSTLAAKTLPEDSTYFLMVGTLEPRKGHAQALDAFEQLWQGEKPVSLIIVGKAGWLCEALEERITNHPQYNKRLYWFKDADDSQLATLYHQSHCLLAASFGEGFGLPLIEAAQMGLPLLVRDLSVFKEVAGTAATYFTADNGMELAATINQWINSRAKNRHLKQCIKHTSWQESADNLMEKLATLSK